MLEAPDLLYRIGSLKIIKGKVDTFSYIKVKDFCVVKNTTFFILARGAHKTPAELTWTRPPAAEKSSQRVTGREAETGVGSHRGPFGKLGKCFDSVISVRDHLRASLEFYCLHKAGWTRAEDGIHLFKERGIAVGKAQSQTQEAMSDQALISLSYWKAMVTFTLSCLLEHLHSLGWSGLKPKHFPDSCERDTKWLSALRFISRFPVSLAHLYHRESGSKVGKFHSWKGWQGNRSIWPEVADTI